MAKSVINAPLPANTLTGIILRCSSCKDDKDSSLFHFNASNKKTGRQSSCKSCVSIASAARTQSKNLPDKVIPIIVTKELTKKLESLFVELKNMRIREDILQTNNQISDFILYHDLAPGPGIELLSTYIKTKDNQLILHKPLTNLKEFAQIYARQIQQRGIKKMSPEMIFQEIKEQITDIRQSQANNILETRSQINLLTELVRKLSDQLE